MVRTVARCIFIIVATFFAYLSLYSVKNSKVSPEEFAQAFTAERIPINLIKSYIDANQSLVNIPIFNGELPIHYAAAYPDGYDLLLVLLQNGATPTSLNLCKQHPTKRTPSCPDSRCPNKMSPIEISIMRGVGKNTDLLLKYRGCLLDKYGETGVCALPYLLAFAVKSGDVNILRLLLSHTHNVSNDLMYISKKKAILFALNNRHFPIAHTLLEDFLPLIDVEKRESFLRLTYEIGNQPTIDLAYSQFDAKNRMDLAIRHADPLRVRKFARGSSTLVRNNRDQLFEFAREIGDEVIISLVYHSLKKRKAVQLAVLQGDYPIFEELIRRYPSLLQGKLGERLIDLTQTTSRKQMLELMCCKSLDLAGYCLLKEAPILPESDRELVGATNGLPSIFLSPSPPTSYLQTTASSGLSSRDSQATWITATSSTPFDTPRSMLLDIPHHHDASTRYLSLDCRPGSPPSKYSSPKPQGAILPPLAEHIQQ